MLARCIAVIALLLVSASALVSHTRWVGRVGVQAVAPSTTLLQAVKLVVTDDTEPVENLLKRFKRAVNQSGHLMELRHRELWETAADKRKRKAERARQLNRIERTNDRYERKGDGGSEYNS